MSRPYKRSTRKNNQPGVSILLSGGIDSAACVAFYLNEGFSVHGLFVDYGQAAVRPEYRSAKAIADHFRIPLSKLQWSGLHRKGVGLIIGRNAFLLSLAMMECADRAGIIAIGVHSGTRYPDCSPAFVQKMQTVFDFYARGRLQIGAPFLHWKKADIWKFCKTSGVPLELTYSCEGGLEQPCGSCSSCRDQEALRACPSQ
jgi:7-cyano-7-deazaguanine synthase